MMPWIYVPEPVRLRSGRVVRRGRYDADIRDGRCTIRVRRFDLDDSLARYNEDLRERWTYPASGATAGVVLRPHEYEMAAESVTSPIDTLV